MFVLMALLHVLEIVHNGAHHTCRGGHGRNRHNVDKDDHDTETCKSKLDSVKYLLPYKLNMMILRLTL